MTPEDRASRAMAECVAAGGENMAFYLAGAIRDAEAELRAENERLRSGAASTNQAWMAEQERIQGLIKDILHWAERGADAIPLSCQQFYARDLERGRAEIEATEQQDQET